MPESAEGALPSVYQLRIVLRGVSPLIWRRLQVRAEDSIAELHAALQIAFAWDGTHLHRFVIHGREYGHDSRLDPREVRLCELDLHLLVDALGALDQVRAGVVAEHEAHPV